MQPWYLALLLLLFLLPLFFPRLRLERQTVTNMTMILCRTTVCPGNHKTNSVGTGGGKPGHVGILLFTSPIPSSPKNMRDEGQEVVHRRVPFHIDKNKTREI